LVEKSNNTSVSMIPNLLSSLRIILAPIIFLTIRSSDNYLIAIVIILALLTDYTDGYFARKLNSITDAGKILDPLADKLCIVAASLAAVFYRDLPMILFVSIAGRDLLILLAGLLIIKKRRNIPVSNVVGKVTVFVLSLTLIVYVFGITEIYEWFYYLAIIFILISLISYLISGWKLLRTKIE